MKKKKILINVIIFIVIVFIAGELSRYQFNKYENMSIEEIIDKRYINSDCPYIQSEDYFFVLYEDNDYDIFYRNTKDENIIINKNNHIN